MSRAWHHYPDGYTPMVQALELRRAEELGQIPEIAGQLGLW